MHSEVWYSQLEIATSPFHSFPKTIASHISLFMALWRTCGACVSQGLLWDFLLSRRHRSPIASHRRWFTCDSRQMLLVFQSQRSSDSGRSEKRCLDELIWDSIVGLCGTSKHTVVNVFRWGMGIFWIQRTFLLMLQLLGCSQMNQLNPIPNLKEQADHS